MRKCKYYLEFADDGGKKIVFPMGIVEGAGEGPVIAVVGGVHGAESCGIAAAIDLYNYLQPEKVRGKVIICTCFNRGAFEEHMAFRVPQDKKSPLMGDCRVLPENATYSEYMTHFFQTKVLEGVDYFVELHGGDVPEDLMDFVMYPTTENPEVDQKSQKMADAYDIQTILSLPASTPSTPGTKVVESCFMLMAAKGIPSLLAESGRYGIYDAVCASTHFKGLKNILSALGILDEEIVKTNDRLYVKYLGSMRSPLNGLWYPFKSIGDIVRKGESIGKITDYFGETMFEVTAPYDAKVTAMRRSFFVNMGHAMYYLTEIGE